jgi:ParB family chromosome partitioning protein
MRLTWRKGSAPQLDLLDVKAPSPATAPADDATAIERLEHESPEPVARTRSATSGAPMLLPVSSIDEDPNNPRTDFPDAELDELADDIRQRGILQPLVVHPADAQGRHRIHFGAKRWRAAQRAGVIEVPVVVRDAPADAYAQVAENQKRHGLTPLDLARFIKGRVEAGESNADIARRLGMNLTTVAHHLSLLDLPPVLDQALKTGRCTSPRTLHELGQLHETQPDKVRALVDGDAAITRAAVAAIKTERVAATPIAKPGRRADAIERANAACERLEQALKQIEPLLPNVVASPELVALRTRVESLVQNWWRGV